MSLAPPASCVAALPRRVAWPVGRPVACVATCGTRRGPSRPVSRGRGGRPGGPGAARLGPAQGSAPRRPAPSSLACPVTPPSPVPLVPARAGPHSRMRARRQWSGSVAVAVGAGGAGARGPGGAGLAWGPARVGTGRASCNAAGGAVSGAARVTSHGVGSGVRSPRDGTLLVAHVRVPSLVHSPSPPHGHGAEPPRLTTNKDNAGKGHGRHAPYPQIHSKQCKRQNERRYINYARPIGIAIRAAFRVRSALALLILQPTARRSGQPERTLQHRLHIASPEKPTLGTGTPSRHVGTHIYTHSPYPHIHA